MFFNLTSWYGDAKVWPAKGGGGGNGTDADADAEALLTGAAGGAGGAGGNRYSAK